jgi:hypothetical protein
MLVYPVISVPGCCALPKKKNGTARNLFPDLVAADGWEEI